MEYALKIIISAILIVAIAEVAKRSSMLGALLASLPVTSILAFIFLYVDSKEVAKVSALSMDIFWLVIPSLTLFIVLPLLLKKGMNFYLSLALACALTIVSYTVMVSILKRTGIM